jgi:hypothetical protein
MTTISKLTALTSLVLAAGVSICHATPIGGTTAGKTATKTVEKCTWVTTTVPVVTSVDKNGFPTIRMETKQIYVCRTVRV